jgi:hypothetical protein
MKLLTKNRPSAGSERGEEMSGQPVWGRRGTRKDTWYGSIEAPWSVNIQQLRASIKVATNTRISVAIVTKV